VDWCAEAGRLSLPALAQPSYGRSLFRPLQVAARMAGALINYGEGLHLDSILAYAAFMRLPREWRESLPPLSLNPWPPDIEIPLARWAVPCMEPEMLPDSRLLDGDGCVWGWRATTALTPWQLHGKAEWRRKPPIGEYMRYTDERRLETGAGPLKAYNVSAPAVFAHTIVWECVGDPDAVSDLLRDIYCLGKKWNRGQGAVLRRDDGSPWWEVEVLDGVAPTMHGIETVDLPSGQRRLARAMPAEYLADKPEVESGGAMMLCIRAPYHHFSRRVWGHMPSAAREADRENLSDRSLP
jgi:hypothetical protein